MTTPEEWLASFEAKIADVQQKAAAFKENLEAAGATETSEDGSLRVTVAPNGSLTELSIGDTAMRGSGDELANQIMKLARKAQRQAAVRVAEAFAPLAGEDSEALQLATGFIPPPEDDEDETPPPDDDGYTFTQAPEDAEQTTRPPEPPRGRSSRPPTPGRDDDEDFDSDQIFGRRDEW